MKFNIELITETLNKKNKIAGVITVFINGVATEVGRGAVDMKAMFGGDYVLLHSSGVAVEVNEHGFLVQSLQHGESYFLVIHFSFNSFYKLIKIPPLHSFSFFMHRYLSRKQTSPTTSAFLM